MIDKLRIGVITATHGLKGEVKVFPTTDDPHRYDSLKDVLIEDHGVFLEEKVSRVRYFKNLVIVKFEDRDRIEDVEKLVKHELYVTRENAVPLEEGEYFIADLIGLQVYEDTGRHLGKLSDVLETGANDVYIVDFEGRELLLPNIPDCIKEVDLENGRMTVHLMEGLL